MEPEAGVAKLLLLHMVGELVKIVSPISHTTFSAPLIVPQTQVSRKQVARRFDDAYALALASSIALSDAH
jgi:hypothetical protein